MDTAFIGKRINIARKDKNLTADKLSELCHINATYLRQIEGGKKVPSLPVFIDICNALKVSPNFLLQDGLTENELSEFTLFTELWKTATPTQIELVTAMMNTALKHTGE